MTAFRSHDWARLLCCILLLCAATAWPRPAIAQVGGDPFESGQCVLSQINPDTRAELHVLSKGGRPKQLIQGYRLRLTCSRVTMPPTVQGYVEVVAGDQPVIDLLDSLGKPLAPEDKTGSRDLLRTADLTIRVDFTVPYLMSAKDVGFGVPIPVARSEPRTLILIRGRTTGAKWDFVELISLLVHVQREQMDSILADAKKVLEDNWSKAGRPPALRPFYDIGQNTLQQATGALNEGRFYDVPPMAAGVKELAKGIEQSAKRADRPSPIMNYALLGLIMLALGGTVWFVMARVLKRRAPTD